MNLTILYMGVEKVWKTNLGAPNLEQMEPMIAINWALKLLTFLHHAYLSTWLMRASLIRRECNFSHNYIRELNTPAKWLIAIRFLRDSFYTAIGAYSPKTSLAMDIRSFVSPKTTKAVRPDTTLLIHFCALTAKILSMDRLSSKSWRSDNT